jgi:hypothetical protein
LARQRAHYVRERIVSKPGHTVVCGLARPHPVARNSWVTTNAADAFACVVPHREHRAVRTDRETRLPLRSSRDIRV